MFTIDQITNKLFCKDNIEIIKEIPNKSIDLIIIDPPYLTTKEKWDKQEVVNEYLSTELFRIAKDTCSLYVWCGIGEKSQSLIRWFPIFSKDWYFKDLITWKKRRGIGMRRGWLYIREECMWFVKDNKYFIWNKNEQYNRKEQNQFKEGFSGYKCLSEFKRYGNVWTDIGEELGNKEIKHFTPKPLEAIKRIIRVHTKENDLILDCFAGSGTTLLACKQLNRKWCGIEISPEYCEIIKQRLQNK
jgi:site-specific DNA-methyltransferase (adenine-specific)